MLILHENCKPPWALSSSCLSSSHGATRSSMAITRAPRSLMLHKIGSRLLHIIAWRLHSILPWLFRAMFHQSTSQHSTRAVCPQLTLCPSLRAALLAGRSPWVQASGIHDHSSLDIAEWYSCCTILSMTLPQDVAVIPVSSIAGWYHTS